MRIFVPGAPLSDTLPVAVTGAAASAGTDGAASRRDHRHDLGPLTAPLNVNTQRLNNTGMVEFIDRAADPDAAGRVNRNADRLLFHNGTAARVLALDTYRFVAQTVLAADAASITFSGLPATLREFLLIFTGRLNWVAAGGFRLRFNGDEGANYSTLITAAATSWSTAQTDIYLAVDGGAGTLHTLHGFYFIGQHNATQRKLLTGFISQSVQNATFGRGGEWTNVVDAISSIELRITGVGSNILAGARAVLLGRP